MKNREIQIKRIRKWKKDRKSAEDRSTEIEEEIQRKTKKEKTKREVRKRKKRKVQQEKKKQKT